MSNNQVQSLMEPLHQGKRARLECSMGTVAPPGLSKTNILPHYSQDKSLAYRQPYLSCSLNGQDLPSPWSPSTIIGRNGGSPAAQSLATEGSITNPVFYKNGAFLVDRSSPTAAQDVSTKHNFAFCTRSPRTHSPSGTGLVSPIALRKVPIGCTNSSHSKPENPIGLAIPKPVYGHSPCCTGRRCTLGHNFAIERGLQRLPHQMFEDDRLAYYGHWTYLNNKEPEALMQQRLLPFEHCTERAQSKDVTTEGFHGFRASRPRHVPPLSDPSRSSYMYSPVHSLVPSPSEHCQRFQMTTQMHKDLVPMYDPVTGMHYTTHMQVYQDCPHLSKYREIPQQSLLYCQKDTTNVYSPENSHLVSDKQTSRPCPVPKPQDSHSLVLPGHPAVRNVPAYPVHRMNFTNATNSNQLNPSAKKAFCPPVVQQVDRPLDFSIRRETNEEPDRQHQISGTFHQTESQDHYKGSNNAQVENHTFGGSCRGEDPISRHDYTAFRRYADDTGNTYQSISDQMDNAAMPSKRQLINNDDCLLNKVQKMDQQTTNEFEPSSPPMPVINKVFSLAPYKAYLEATGVLSPVQDPKCPKMQPKSVSTKEEQEAQTSDPNTNLDKTPTLSSNDSTQVRKVEFKKERMELDERSCQSEVNRNPSPVIGHNDQDLSIKKEEEDFEKQANLKLNIVIKSDCESECKPVTPKISEPSVQSNSECGIMNTGVNTVPFLNSDTKHTDLTSILSKPQVLQLTHQTKFPIGKIPLQCLKLTSYKIILPEVLKTPEPPVLEVPNSPAELKPDKTSRKTQHQFMELHQSLCGLLSGCISQASHCELKDWLSKLGLAESASRPAKNQKIACLLGSKAREVWMKGQEIAQVLQKVLCLLESYVRSRECPFPHVIRAGAVFIPMLVVKEVLFPQVQGNFIDQVLQEHHVELRPTTLSEERQLTQLHKRAFSSKLRRLLSLKHLPDVYLDVLNLLHYSTVCKVLGIEVNSTIKKEYVECSDQAESTSKAHCVFPLPNIPDTASSLENREQNSSQKRCKSKGRVKSACKRIFLRDDASSAEDEPAKESQTWSFARMSEGEEYKSTEAVCTEDGGHIEVKIEEDPEQEPENSWGRPLTSDDLSSDGTEMETEMASWTSGQSCSSSSTKKNSLSKKRSGMVLKLRKVYYTNSTHGQVSHYQRVPDQAEIEGADRHRLHRRKSKIRSSGCRRSQQRSYSSSKCPSMKRKRKRWFLRSEVQNTQQAMKNSYPDLVGKRICHLYEENDKTEVWYRGVVLHIHEANPNPLKTVFEVKYDSEPEWQYYLELLVDYQKGWLKIEN